MLFKDSAQAANRYIYNHSVGCPSMNAAADDAILGGVTMVTINPLPQKSLSVGVLCSPWALGSIGMHTCTLKWRQNSSAFYA